MKSPGRPPSTPPGQHGTFSEYDRGCRCKPCGYAMSQHQAAVRARVKNGTADLTVSAEAAQKHLEWLSSKGVGFRAVADCLGWDKRRVQDVRAGRRPRIRKSAEQLILSVGPDAGSPGSITSVGPTRSLVKILENRGFTRKQIADEYYGRTDRPGLQWIYGRYITVATKVRMERAYKQLMGRVA